MLQLSLPPWLLEHQWIWLPSNIANQQPTSPWLAACTTPYTNLQQHTWCKSQECCTSFAAAAFVITFSSNTCNKTVKLWPNCQHKWPSLLVIIISFLLFLIVASVFINFCRFLWPLDTHLLKRTQYRENLGNSQPIIPIFPLLSCLLPLPSLCSVTQPPLGSIHLFFQACCVFFLTKHSSIVRLTVTSVSALLRDRLKAHLCCLFWSCFLQLSY